MRLETAFIAAIEDVRTSLGSEQEQLKSELSALLAASGLPGTPGITLGLPLAFTPSLAALSEPAALGLAAHLTQLAGTPASAQTAGLSQLIAADFAPITEKLAAEASRVFHEGTSAFAGQAEALIFGPPDRVIGNVSLALKETQAGSPANSEASVRALGEAVSSLKLLFEA
jgi:hypothetical protein